MRWAEELLSALKRAALYRRRVRREGLLDFCSNDYLCLARHPRVVAAARRVLEEEGLGSGASQLVSGYTRYHELLERELADFKGFPSCLLFGSGYLANAGALPALAGEGDLIASDELNHASIIDGVRLSKAERFVFPHRDYDALERFLRQNRHRFKKVLVVTDTVFSMDGTVADLPRLYEIAERYDCLLYLDEAHATGTLGRGALERFNLPYREFVLLMGTLSKALGAYGAFVCASKPVTELLLNRARTAIFSTSLPPSVCAGALEALRVLKERPELPERLREKERRLVELLNELGLPYAYHGTPVIPVLVGDEEAALRLSRALREEGVLVQAIRYPTVPKGKARLRLTARLCYGEEEFNLLKEAFKKALKRTSLDLTQKRAGTS
ncbi:MAG: 8-amino-7-oxononanoate synthase [Aquificae bacterium]|nr:8-amino-7-oxononanoate synthase [Aquificota bacterium]